MYFYARTSTSISSVKAEKESLMKTSVQSILLLVVAVLSMLVSGGLEGLPLPPSSSWTALIICGFPKGAFGDACLSAQLPPLASSAITQSLSA